MNEWSFLLIALIVPLLTGWILRSARKAEKDLSSDAFTVRPPKIVLWVGIIGVVFFVGVIVAMTLFPNDTATWQVYVGFSLFILLPLSLVLYGSKWRIIVNGQQITVVPLIRKPVTFFFADISNVKHVTSGIKVYSGGKKMVSIENQCIGYATFLNRLMDEGIRY